jgi:transposase
MANVLKMAMIQSILHLHSLRWSQRRIARELGIDRGTVGRYLSRHLRPPNAAIPPTGSDDEKPSRRSTGKRGKITTTACQS